MQELVGGSEVSLVSCTWRWWQLATDVRQQVNNLSHSILRTLTESLRAEMPTPPSSQIFDLILSFPLLEDLTVITSEALADNTDGPDGLPTAVYPSTSPMTGSLTLFQQRGMKPLAPWLLSLPGGIHFKKLTLVSSLRGRSFAGSGVGGAVFSDP